MIKHSNWGFSAGKNPTKLEINSFSEYWPSINFLDVSPHSLEEITYKVYFKRAHGTNSSVNTNRDGNNSTQMVLLEVKQ